MSSGYILFTQVLLVTSLVVLPIGYMLVLSWLQQVGAIRTLWFEFFVAFGTFGGLLLTVAFSPSVLSILGVGFTMFISLPFSIFCIARVTSRDWRKSKPHRIALIALYVALAPLLAGLLAVLIFK